MATNFTPDNTAPDAKTSPATSPDNTAPDATSRVLTPDNTAPTALAPAVAAPADAEPEDYAATDFTPSNVAPGATAPTATAPDNTAPTTLSAAAAAPADAAPDALAAAAASPDNTAPAALAATALAPAGAAPASLAPLAAAPVDASPDSVSTPHIPGGAEPPQPMPNGDPLPAATDSTVNTPVINLPGALVLNQIYGQTRLPANSSLTRAQVQLSDAPTGADAKVTLVDSDGVSLGVIVTIPAGQTFGETLVAPALALLAGANLRAKVTQIGAAEPGGFGIVTLFAQLT